MKKLVFSLVFLCSMVAGMAFLPGQASAAVAPECANSFLGFPSWYAYLDVEYREISPGESACEVTGPSDGDKLDIPKVVLRVSLAVIDILLRLAGIVAFFFIVISGFKFTLSQGNSDQEKEARETAINALIGMVIAMVSVGIVTFIGRQLVS